MNVVAFKDLPALLPGELEDYKKQLAMTPAERVVDLAAFRARQAKLFPPQKWLSESEAIELANSRIKEYAAAHPAGETMPVDSEAASRFEFQSAEQFIDQPPMRWLIPDVLPQAELAVIYGASGSGKSFLAYDMAAAITRGAEWAGRQCVRGKVGYFAAEGGVGFVGRVKAYAERNGGFHDLPVMTMNAPNMMERADPDLIVYEMKRTGPYAAIIFDTLSRIHQGNESSGEDMSKVIKFCQMIYQATGALVILIGHTGKDESKAHRGWSGVRAAADCEIEVTCDKAKNRTWTTVKQKDGSDNIGAPFALKQVVLGVDDAMKEITSCVVTHEGVTPKAAVVKRKRPKNNPLIVLQAMEKEFQGQAPTLDELYDVVAEDLTCARSDSRKQYFKSAVQALADTETNKWLWRFSDDRVSLSSVEPIEGAF